MKLILQKTIEGDFHNANFNRFSMVHPSDRRMDMLTHRARPSIHIVHPTFTLKGLAPKEQRRVTHPYLRGGIRWPLSVICHLLRAFPTHTPMSGAVNVNRDHLVSFSPVLTMVVCEQCKRCSVHVTNSLCATDDERASIINCVYHGHLTVVHCRLKRLYISLGLEVII